MANRSRRPWNHPFAIFGMLAIGLFTVRVISVPNSGTAPCLGCDNDTNCPRALLIGDPISNLHAPGRRLSASGIRTGASRPGAEATLDDFLQHPIWLWAVDEETMPGRDETWQKPVLGATDVGKELVDRAAIIAVRLVGTEFHGAAVYYHSEGYLLSPSIFHDGEWKEPHDIEGLARPAVLESVPTILGRKGIRFRCQSLKAWRKQRGH